MSGPQEPQDAQNPQEPQVPESLAARRRLVMLAIRHEHERPPAGLEVPGLQIAQRQAALKWITWLYVFGFFIEVALVLTAKTDSSRILNVLLAVLFFLVARVQYRSVRRAADAVARWAPLVPDVRAERGPASGRDDRSPPSTP